LQEQTCTFNGFQIITESKGCYVCDCSDDHAVHEKNLPNGQLHVLHLPGDDRYNAKSRIFFGLETDIRIAEMIGLWLAACVRAICRSHDQ